VSVLEHRLTIRDRHLLYGERIIALVCREFGVTRAGLLGRRKMQHLTWPRHVAMYLVYELTDLSSVCLAEVFMRDDHATILHAAKKVRNWIETDASRRRDVEELRAMLTPPDDHANDQKAA
jgi:chromosomal replication initiator protein